jgi:hypothetical protein
MNQPDEKLMRSVRALRCIREDDREAAISALVAFGEPAIAPLCAFLEQETWDLKPAAAEALGRIATTTNSPALRAALPRLRRERTKVRAWLEVKALLYSPTGGFAAERRRELEPVQRTLEIYRQAIAAIEPATAKVSELPLPTGKAEPIDEGLPVPAVVPAKAK